jgi:alpha-glucosidase
MLLLTLRGTPFVYMGDEIGQADGEIPPDRVVDVDGRDPERTPVQWDGSPGAGFSHGAAAEPWLPVGPEAARVNVAAQRDDPASMLTLYRRLIWFRKGSPALHGSGYRSLPDAPGGCYAYLRTAGDERLLVALNFTGEELEYPVGGHQRGRLELSTDPSRPTGQELSLGPLRLGPDEGAVVRLP